MSKVMCFTIIALVFAVPAYAGVNVTKKQAKNASYVTAELTLAPLLNKAEDDSAKVSVSGCTVSGRRGRCRVSVRGTSHCTYTSRVFKTLKEDFLVWAEDMRCD